MIPRLAVHDAQVPSPGALNLDHVAHFVPDREAAASALARLGFTTTPFSEQFHRLEADGPLVPAGTGNRCVMLREGYLEFLTPFLDTPVAAQLRDAIARYTGVHLIAYGTADAEADHARLSAEGFAPPPAVRLQREAEAASGTTTVRFVVTRTPPGTMPEGRIQFCGHQTPEGVWQLRWLDHANRAAGLRRVFLVLADPAEAATRYARYAGLPSDRVAGPSGTEFVQQTERGALHLMDAEAFRAQFDPGASMALPPLPWIAGYELASDDLSITRAVLENGGSAVTELRDGRLRVLLPPELGGFILFSARC
ncbi:MAG: VOC family protein [Burkholderiales bacterium]|jgi:hypothetical protein|nr:VOC family protein [Burkholderiales bacterium]